MSPGSTFTLRSAGGGELLVAVGPNVGLRDQASDRVQLQVRPDRRAAATAMALPTAMQWRPPIPGLPAAMVVRAAERDALGRSGPVRLITKVTADHGGLHVLSVWLPEGALFHPDSGIYVPGHAMLAPPADMLSQYLVDGRWWKYPGNYHYRGKAWERRGLLQFIAPDGQELMHRPVRVRSHGQMTRGFPQHALRLLFDEPLDVPVFADGDGRGMKAMVLRAAGNDQVKAVMRDALLQDLCLGIGFEVSRATTCVVYINGAYWGVHHLRQRMDEKELARRHGLSPGNVAMVEVRMKRFNGEASDVSELDALVRSVTEATDLAAAIAALEQRLDLDDHLRYMAAMMVLANRDWPGDNIKLWRVRKANATTGARDGRWRMIAGDMDMGFGAIDPRPGTDLYEQVARSTSPVARLFRALMKDERTKARFEATVQELLNGPLSRERLLARIKAQHQLMAPEMDRHTARWRRPVIVRHGSSMWQRCCISPNTGARPYGNNWPLRRSP